MCFVNPLFNIRNYTKRVFAQHHIRSLANIRAGPEERSFILHLQLLFQSGSIASTTNLPFKLAD